MGGRWTAYQASPDIMGGVGENMRGLRFVGLCTVCSDSCLPGSIIVSSVSLPYYPRVWYSSSPIASAALSSKLSVGTFAGIVRATVDTYVVDVRETPGSAVEDSNKHVRIR